MDPRDFRAPFAYDAWANREALASLGGDGAPPRGVRLLAHIAATRHLWLDRLLAQPQRRPVWPDLPLAECGPLLASSEARWDDYLQGLGPDDLARPVAYTNTKGQPWTNPVEHILLHVPLHSHYHRGQIASLVRAAGREPAYTDFIHAVRSQSFHVEEVPRD